MFRWMCNTPSTKGGVFVRVPSVRESFGVVPKLRLPPLHVGDDLLMWASSPFGDGLQTFIHGFQKLIFHGTSSWVDIIYSSGGGSAISLSTSL
jgi:hypothetical protein